MLTHDHFSTYHTLQTLIFISLSHFVNTFLVFSFIYNIKTSINKIKEVPVYMTDPGDVSNKLSFTFSARQTVNDARLCLYKRWEATANRVWEI